MSAADDDRGRRGDHGCGSAGDCGTTRWADRGAGGCGQRAERAAEADPGVDRGAVEGDHVGRVLGHFIHVRSAAADATPLLTHGWPGSVVEFLAMIGPLTDPAAHGADDSAPAFDVVIPSLPGFALSGPTNEPGWDVKRIAAAWAELMSRLGYDRYLAHGGDFGAHVSREVGLLEPDKVIGVHLTELPSASPEPADATDDDADQRSIAPSSATSTSCRATCGSNHNAPRPAPSR